MTKHPTREHSSNHVVARLERLEMQQRGLDATRLQLIGAAVAVAIGNRQHSGHEREMAYRALRAELALALNRSEHQIKVQMSLAHELLNDYAKTLGVLEETIVSSAHCRIIVDAGAVIGVADTATVAERQASLDSRSQRRHG